jgi:hypothetical protein
VISTSLPDQSYMVATPVESVHPTPAGDIAKLRVQFAPGI